MFGNKLTNEELIIKWKNSLLFQKKSSQTISSYGELINRFSKYINKSFLKVTKADVQQFLEDYHYLEAATLHRYYSTIASFYWWLEEKGYISEHPMPKFKNKPKLRRVGYEKEIEYLDDEEKKKVYNHFADNERNLMIFNFMLGTGGRSSEIIEVTVDDINFEECSVRFNGKGDKVRTVFISEELAEMLKQYLEKNKIVKGYIFLNQNGKKLSQSYINWIFREARLKTGIKKLHPHIMRHTFATDSLKNGMNLEVVQEQLGHADISTTRIYAKVLNGIRKVQAQKYAPRIYKKEES